MLNPFRAAALYALPAAQAPARSAESVRSRNGERNCAELLLRGCPVGVAGADGDGVGHGLPLDAAGRHDPRPLPGTGLSEVAVS